MRHDDVHQSQAMRFQGGNHMEMCIREVEMMEEEDLLVMEEEDLLVMAVETDPMTDDVDLLDLEY